jgi:alcohol dehydrogenase class IV
VEAKRYKFFTPTQLIFGEGCSGEVGQQVKALGGTKVLLVSDRGLEHIGLVAKVKQWLEEEGVQVVVYGDVAENPTANNVHEGRDLILKHGLDVVVALGGGSPMDAAKAMSGLSVHEGEITDYEYGLKSFTRSGPPIVVIPTTAGTGAEATMGAVISDPKTRRKIDVVSAFIAPSLSLVDPELTTSLPPALTAATGMDALTHSVEGYTASLAHPLTDAIHLGAIELIGRYLLRAYHEGADQEARHYLMMASMMAGIGFPNSGLGAVHGLALPLGGQFNIPHGVANAILLPHVMKFNMPACRERLREVAVALGARRQSAAGAVDQVFALRAEMHIPALASFGVVEDHLAALARDALGRNTNCVTNPRPVTEADAKAIYRKALGEQQE